MEIPRTREGWDRFSWHHRSSHAAIRQAIRTQKGVNLPEYILEPIDFNRFTDFLQANSQTHIDMLSILGIQGEDLQDVDVRNANQLSAWTWLHYLDHFNAEKALGI